jgi:hypothetical protein
MTSLTAKKTAYWRTHAGESGRSRTAARGLRKAKDAGEGSRARVLYLLVLLPRHMCGAAMLLIMERPAGRLSLTSIAASDATATEATHPLARACCRRRSINESNFDTTVRLSVRPDRP